MDGAWEGWNVQVVCIAFHVSWFCFSGTNFFYALQRKWTLAHVYCYEPKL